MGLPGAIIGGASAAASFIQQGKNQDAQSDFAQQQFETNRRLVTESFHQQAGQIRTRTQQERAQIAQETTDLTIEAANLRGTVAASAGSSGVSGTSVAESQRDVEVQEERGLGRLNTLQEFREASAELRIKALETQAEGRILAATPAPVAEQSLLGGLLQVGSGAFSGFALGQQIQLGI